MKQIETGLYSYYDPDNPSTGSSNIEPMEVTHPATATENWIPFAKVTLVTEGSPADYAVGLNFIGRQYYMCLQFIGFIVLFFVKGFESK